MIATSAFPLILGLLGQAPPPPGPDDKTEESAARLDFMKKSAKTYTVRATGDRPATYRLVPEPIIRYSNPVGQSKDGTIFLWLGERDRPEVAVQVNVTRTGYWDNQFSSLSTRPLVAERRSGPVWSPRRGGVEFKPVPDAPRPAEAAEPRLRQMRILAEGFAVLDDFQRQSWQQLRLLARPPFRYGKPGTDLIDGAVFCFALTTDPEAFLLLEARAGTGGPGWHYAFAPITTYPIKASYKGREAYDSVDFGYDSGPTGMIFNTPYRPEEAGP